MTTYSLREEIEDIVRNTRDMTSPKVANIILQEIEKRIEELRKEHPKDLYGAYNAGLDDVMDMLK